VESFSISNKFTRSKAGICFMLTTDEAPAIDPSAAFGVSQTMLVETGRRGPPGHRAARFSAVCKLALTILETAEPDASSSAMRAGPVSTFSLPRDAAVRSGPVARAPGSA
jgi:hypothetical protein